MSGCSGLTANGVLDLRCLAGARLSPRGTQVVYALATTADDGATDLVHLEIVDLETGERRELTHAEAEDGAPTWYPDGSAIVFRSTRSGIPQLHWLSVADRAQRPHVLAELPWGVGTAEPRVAPDGSSVIVSAPVRGPRDPAEPYRVTGALWRLEGLGLTREAVQELFMIEGSKAPRQLTTHGEMVIAYEWTPSGSEILYLTARDGDSPTYTLRKYALAAGASTPVWATEYLPIAPSFMPLPRGRIVRTTANAAAMGDRADVVVTDARADAAERSCANGVDGWIFGPCQTDFPTWAQISSPRLVVAPNGREAFVSVQVGRALEIWALNLEHDAVARRVLTGARACVPLDCTDEHLLVSITTLHEPPDLWLTDHDGNSPRRLSHLNPDYSPGRWFDAQELHATSADGTTIDVSFLSPKRGDHPRPTILICHGGPHAAWGNSFSYDACLLASAGRAIVLANQRGSTGYSDAFAHQLRGNWGGMEVADLLAAVDAVVNEGLADPAALGVFGGSGGGFLTAWLVTHTDRFRAAVAENAILDWTMQIGADLGPRFAECLTREPSPDVPDVDTRARMSPISTIERCSTPILLIKHDHDVRTPGGQADSFFTLLKLHGCEAEMLCMPATGHRGSSGLGSPRTRVAQNEALLDWFGRYL